MKEGMKMGVAMTLKEYLDSNAFDYEVIEHRRATSPMRVAETVHVPGDAVAKPVLLGDDDSYLLAVIPATHRLELDRLNQLTARELVLIAENELDSAFSDCERGAIPPVGTLYGIDTVLDVDLAGQSDVYFEFGDHEHLIHMRGDEFLRLMEDAPRAHVSHHL